MIPKTAPITRILVVEDVQETRNAIKALLESSGYDVVQACNEDDAVERLALTRPNLILISLGGPADQLLDTARSIRARAGFGQQIPYVIFYIHTVPEGSEQ